MFPRSPVRQLTRIHFQKKTGRTQSTSSQRDSNDSNSEVTKDLKSDDLESHLEGFAREKAQLER
jgi:hypothetical protein